MSRLSQTFKRLKEEGRKALAVFITVGDPSLKETTKLVETLAASGADIIELGIPFSDPMADGPVIQAASERALKKGVTLQRVLKVVADVRQKVATPILLMGYYNPIFVMGEELFAKRAAAAGVDAVLVVDLPPEEAYSLKAALQKNKIDLIFLLAPTSTEERIKKVKKLASGFIYYVSLTGVTGAVLSQFGQVGSFVRKIKAHIDLPVMVGFGISKPADALSAAKQADGVVVGSALVSLIRQNADSSKKLHTRVSHFVRSIKKVL